jgi:hypothetical protein
MTFAFDAREPVGQRVKADTVLVNGQALDDNALYSVATLSFMSNGKDG